MTRESYPYGPLALFDLSPKGTSPFAKNVAQILKKELGQLEVKRFKDGETDIRIDDSVRGKDVFVFQSYTPPIGERLHELYEFLDASKEGGLARRVTVVFPHAFGSRGERRIRPRQPVPTLVVAKSLKANGADKVVAVDIHTNAIGTVYNAVGLEFENLEFEYLAANFIINHAEGDVVLASPDAGGTKRVQKIREIIESRPSKLRLSTAYADKHRPAANVAEIYDVTGDVNGKVVYIVDDIADTLGTLTLAAEAIRKKGAKEVRAVICHPVMSPGAQGNIERLLDGGIADGLVIGDTIPLRDFVMAKDNIRIIPLEPLVASAIRRLNRDESISQLHRYGTIVDAYNNGTENLFPNPKYVRIK